MEKIIIEYYANEATKLHKIVDKILKKYGGIYYKDIDDFYSLANEIFVISLRDFDSGKCNFDGFLYSNLSRRITTEIRDRNRAKRSNTKANIDEDGNITYEFQCDISLNTPANKQNNGCEEFTIGDLFASDFNLETEVIEEKREEYSDKMMKYLDMLSELQKEILRLTIAGYIASEIMEELHITYKQYSENNAAIHSYRNVSILF